MTLRLEIEIEWHSKCNRQNRFFKKKSNFFPHHPKLKVRHTPLPHWQGKRETSPSGFCQKKKIKVLFPESYILSVTHTFAPLVGRERNLPISTCQTRNLSKMSAVYWFKNVNFFSMFSPKIKIQNNKFWNISCEVIFFSHFSSERTFKNSFKQFAFLHSFDAGRRTLFRGRHKRRKIQNEGYFICLISDVGVIQIQPINVIGCIYSLLHIDIHRYFICLVSDVGVIQVQPVEFGVSFLQCQISIEILVAGY